MLDLARAAGEVARLLDGVTDDALTGPTPCPEYSVAALLDHLMGLTLAFTWAAEKTAAQHGDGPAPGTSVAADLDPDWRALLPGRLEELAAAWHEPDAWEGESQAGGVTMPAGEIGGVALNELVMHGWDLARATGQPYACDPASTALVLAFSSETMKPENAEMRAGLFGPAVEIPDGATDFERALAYAGRDPNWAPPSTSEGDRR